MKFHHTINQAPRSLKDGRHRKTSPPVHGRPDRQSGYTWPAGTFLTIVAGTWTTWNTTEPEPAIENAGIRAGEIIAHRGWRVDDGKLRSIYKRQHIWRPGEPMTGDVRGEYGVHAFKAREQVDTYCMLSAGWGAGLITAYWTSLGMEVEPVEDPIYAIGTVALWGEVIEHERGYRAEFAKVASIDALTVTDDAMLAQLRAAYL